MTFIYEKSNKICYLAIIALAMLGCSSEQASNDVSFQPTSNNTELSASVKSVVDSEARVAMLDLLSTIEQVQEKISAAS